MRQFLLKIFFFFFFFFLCFKQFFPSSICRKQKHGAHLKPMVHNFNWCSIKIRLLKINLQHFEYNFRSASKSLQSGVGFSPVFDLLTSMTVFCGESLTSLISGEQCRLGTISLFFFLYQI